MSDPNDGAAIHARGWCQGAVLGDALRTRAWEQAPNWIDRDEAAHLVVTSQDCDVVSRSFSNEPFVEVLAVRLRTESKPDKFLKMGRNPRRIEITVEWMGAETTTLTASVHERWVIRRELLLDEDPAYRLEDGKRELIANWLAKRYIRAAFPSEFDRRWKSKAREWEALLTDHSASILGVYLRVTTMDELGVDVPYRCDFIVAVHREVRDDPLWEATHDAIKDEIEAFWGQFKPGIICDEVLVRGPGSVTLEMIEEYQRFDADWISVEDETPLVAPTVAVR